jgi:hypothetical protein
MVNISRNLQNLTTANHSTATWKQRVHHSYGINRSKVRPIRRLCGGISLPQLGPGEELNR